MDDAACAGIDQASCDSEFSVGPGDAAISLSELTYSWTADDPSQVVGFEPSSSVPNPTVTVLPGSTVTLTLTVQFGETDGDCSLSDTVTLTSLLLPTTVNLTPSVIEYCGSLKSQPIIVDSGTSADELVRGALAWSLVGNNGIERPLKTEVGETSLTLPVGTAINGTSLCATFTNDAGCVSVECVDLVNSAEPSPTISVDVLTVCVGEIVCLDGVQVPDRPIVYSARTQSTWLTPGATIPAIQRFTGDPAV